MYKKQYGFIILEIFKSKKYKTIENCYDKINKNVIELNIDVVKLIL